MPHLLREHLDFKIELLPHEQKLLPLFHVCTKKKMQESLSAKKIVADDICAVFNERILYTFYGASKFKSGKTWNPSSRGDISVCMIFNTDQCDDIARIYPLDTGLASGTAKDDNCNVVPQTIIGWDKIKNALNLGNVKSRINKIILHSFKNINNYIDGRLEQENGEIISRFPDNGYIDHINDIHTIFKSPSIGDDRRFTVEVHFDNEMDLFPDRLLGIIAPALLYTNEQFLEQIKQFRMEKNTEQLKNIVRDMSICFPSASNPNNINENKIKEISIALTKSINNIS